MSTSVSKRAKGDIEYRDGPRYDIVCTSQYLSDVSKQNLLERCSEAVRQAEAKVSTFEQELASIEKGGWDMMLSKLDNGESSLNEAREANACDKAAEKVVAAVASLQQALAFSDGDNMRDILSKKRDAATKAVTFASAAHLAAQAAVDAEDDVEREKCIRDAEKRVDLAEAYFAALEREEQSRDLLKPTKEQLWMMLAEWAALRPLGEKDSRSENKTGKLGGVLLDCDGALLDVCSVCFDFPVSADATSDSSCTHGLADLVCKFGRSACAGGTLYLSRRLACSLCAKLVVQSGITSLVQQILADEVKTTHTKSGSTRPTRDSPAASPMPFSEPVQLRQNSTPKIVTTLFQRSTVALHEFSLQSSSPDAWGALEDLKQLLKDDHANNLQKAGLQLPDSHLLGNFSAHCLSQALRTLSVNDLMTLELDVVL